MCKCFADWLSAASHHAAHWLSRITQLTQLQAAGMHACQNLTIHSFKITVNNNILTTEELNWASLHTILTTSEATTPRVKSRTYLLLGEQGPICVASPGTRPQYTTTRCVCVCVCVRECPWTVMLSDIFIFSFLNCECE